MPWSVFKNSASWLGGPLAQCDFIVKGRPSQRTAGSDPRTGRAPTRATALLQVLPYVLTLTGCPSCSCRPGLKCRRSLVLDVDGDVSEVAGAWLPWYIIPEVYPFAFRGSGARVWFAESDL